jgi:hypothetical protein
MALAQGAFMKRHALAAVVALGLLLPAAADAAPFALRICDDAACDGVGDLSIPLGGFSSSSVPGWSHLQLATFPSGDYPDDPTFRFTFDAISHGPDAEQLWIDLTGTDFTHVGFVSNFHSLSLGWGNVTVAWYGGSSNDPFDLARELSAHDRVGDGINPYSVTLRVALDHPAPGAGSRRSIGSAEIVPEPVSTALMAIGLLGVCARRRR